jgi:NADP-dependent 3-hydroxy acid dehydrogenase YdfG
MMQPRTTAIIGVGPGNGAALARRFSRGGRPVALLSRSIDKLEKLAADLDGKAEAFGCDASDPASVKSALEEAARRLGPIDALLYNAGSGVFGSIDEITAEDLEAAWRINVLGLYAAVKTVLPGMRERGEGRVLVTGATASVRGGAGFAAFAPAKAAQRSLAQSLARKLGPEGIHVAIAIVDGVVDLARTRQMMPDRPNEAFLQPDDVADAMWFLAEQPRSAWTFELDLRPHFERF